MRSIYRRLLTGLAVVVTLALLPGFPALTQNGIDPDTLARMDAVEAAVSDLRGLDVAGSTARAVMTRDELEAWLVEELSEMYSPDDLLFYYAFDFMPLDTDLWQLQLDLLTEQVGGFYDPEAQRMVVVSEGFDAAAELIYAHEFTHALQDEHFDLERLGVAGDRASDDPDLLLARLALIEGDAQQMTQDYLMWRVQDSGDAAFALGLFGDLANVSTAQFDSAPPIARAELLFPYLDGQQFVQEALNRGGWALVDAVYDRPPLSTEQILHPDQYFNADEPQLVEVALPDAVLSPHWRQTHHATLGEFYLREYLSQRIPDDDAVRAAEGWGGDRFAVYTNDNTGGVMLLYRLRWDSASHGSEFTEAFTAFAEARYGTGSVTEPAMGLPEGATCWDGAARAPGRALSELEAATLRTDSTCVITQGSNTLLVQGPDLNTVMAVWQLQPGFE